MIKFASMLVIPLAYFGYMYSTVIRGFQLHKKIRRSNVKEVRSQKDCMGYDNSEFLKDYSDEEILIAQALAASDDYKNDPIRNDPRVTGKRYLKYAKVAYNAINGVENGTDEVHR